MQKHQPKQKPTLVWREPQQPMSNLAQEKIILAILKKTNPEAYKLLKNYGLK